MRSHSCATGHPNMLVWAGLRQERGSLSPRKRLLCMHVTFLRRARKCANHRDWFSQHPNMPIQASMQKKREILFVQHLHVSLLRPKVKARAPTRLNSAPQPVPWQDSAPHHHPRPPKPQGLPLGTQTEPPQCAACRWPICIGESFPQRRAFFAPPVFDIRVRFCQKGHVDRGFGEAHYHVTTDFLR